MADADFYTNLFGWKLIRGKAATEKREIVVRQLSQ